MHRPIRSSDVGATLVEAAVSVFVFFFVVMGGLDLIVSSYRILAVGYVTNRAARFLTTKKLLPGQTTELASLQEFLYQSGRGYGVEIPKDNIRVCPIAYCDDAFADSVGVTGDILQLQVAVPVKSSILNLNMTHLVRRTFRNEGPLAPIRPPCVKIENGQQKKCGR